MLAYFLAFNINRLLNTLYDEKNYFYLINCTDSNEPISFTARLSHFFCFKPNSYMHCSYTSWYF